jgi:hypothetical protein
VFDVLAESNDLIQFQHGDVIFLIATVVTFVCVDLLNFNVEFRCCFGLQIVLTKSNGDISWLFTKKM